MRLVWPALCLFLAGFDLHAVSVDDRGLDTHATLARHERLMEEAKAAGDKAALAAHAALACNGAQYVRFERDGASCKLAKELARELGDLELEAYVVGCQALFEVWLLDWPKARAYLDEGWRIAGDQPAPAARFVLGLAEGAYHHERAEYEPARAALLTSVAGAELTRSPVAISLAESSLARLLWVVGDLGAAERHAQRALDQGFLQLDGNSEWLARWVLGLVEDDRGRTEHALAQWRLGVIAAKRARVFWGQTLLSTNVSYALLSLGRVEEAAPFTQEKRVFLEKGLLPKSWEPELEQLEGSVAFGRKDYATAISHFDRALAKTDRGRLVARALIGKARSLYRMGRLPEARAAYEALLRRLETTREHAPEDQRGSFLAANLAGYQELISLVWDESGEKGAEEAFRVAEAGRARSLLDALHAAGKSVVARPAISTAALRERLGPGQAYLAWVSTEQRLLGIAVAHGEVRLRLLDGAGSREALGARVRYYRRLLEEIDDPREAHPAGQKLYSDLVAPLLPEGTETLLVSPDGPLTYLPLDALVLPDGRFLVEAVAVAQVPSASLAFAAPAHEPARAPVLAVADPPPRDGFPPLPHAREEANVVVAAAAGDGRLLVGEGASERAIRQTTGQPASVWHFATHARTDEAIPMRSALVLAREGEDDGLLTAAEIYALTLPAAIVVLSGCETGLGAWLGSEGAQSLSRAFLFAGAPSVVSTLWAIGDRSSEPIMATFYRRLAAGDVVPAALARAKREAIQRGAPPRAWAAFVASGPPDARVGLRSPSRRATWFVLPAAFAAGLLLVWALRRRK